jgi:hypothetical protein
MVMAIAGLTLAASWEADVAAQREVVSFLAIDRTFALASQDSGGWQREHLSQQLPESRDQGHNRLSLRLSGKFQIFNGLICSFAALRSVGKPIC